MPTTMWDAQFDPRIRKVAVRMRGIHAEKLCALLSETNCATLAAVKALDMQSHCLQGLTVAVRVDFLRAVSSINDSGNAAPHLV